MSIFLLSRSIRRKQNSLDQLISDPRFNFDTCMPSENTFVIYWLAYLQQRTMYCVLGHILFFILIRVVGNLHYSSTSGCLYLVQNLLFTSCIKSWLPCAVFGDSFPTHFWTTQLTGTQHKEILNTLQSILFLKYS